MILGAVDWTDAMHTGGSFIFTSLHPRLLFFMREGDVDTWPWLIGRLVLVGR